MPDCAQVRAVLQRAVTGVPVGREALDQALRHVDECPDCAPLRDALRDAVADGQVPEPWPDAGPPEQQVDPSGLFEGAWVAGLADPDPVVRERAAGRLGEHWQLEPASLASLADAAAADDEPVVRSAAMAALERLEAREPLSARLADWWHGATAAGARELAAALGRLLAPPQAAALEMVALQRLSMRSALRGPPSLPVAGEAGISGRLELVDTEIRLSLSGLPRRYEGRRVTIAIPGALGPDPPPVRWAGDRGLVVAPRAVSGGSIRIALGEATEPGAVEHHALAELLLFPA